LTSLQQRLVKTGGRLVKHARLCFAKSGSPVKNILAERLYSFSPKNEIRLVNCLAERFETRRGSVVGGTRILPQRATVVVVAEGWLNRLKCSSRPSLVPKVETTHLREFNNLSHLGRLNGPWLRGVFAQP